MKIAIVGLGLIGGSFARSISKYTDNEVYAISSTKNSIDSAKNDGAIVDAIDTTMLSDMDVTIVCLPPRATIRFLLDNVMHFREGSIVSDVCGVKCAVLREVEQLYTQYRVDYISIHPMAGRECSGYVNSTSELFKNRSLIMIDNPNVARDKADILSSLMTKLGFSITTSTKEHHDEVIAYTSQLCHITSNAFVKSPTSREHNGFSGGSYEDLTRVAFLDPELWVELFSMNRPALLGELTRYIDELTKYRDALETEDYATLARLLREGRDIKASI